MKEKEQLAVVPAPSTSGRGSKGKELVRAGQNLAREAATVGSIAARAALHTPYAAASAAMHQTRYLLSAIGHFTSVQVRNVFEQKQVLVMFVLA